MRSFLPLLAVTCAIAIWAASLHYVDLSRMNDFGLISVLPPTIYIAMGILTVSFCATVHHGTAPFPILLAHVVALILMIHATPTILYGTLRYAWAWKHIGIVDYIQRHGSVKPDISFMNVYHNWPGFFALAALFTQAAGFKSALSLAAWGPPFYNLINLGGLLLILNTFTPDRRLIWMSVWFFYLTNWAAQDYFSPQATVYFLNLVILGVLLTWFRVITIPPASTIRRWLVFDKAVHFFNWLVRNPWGTEIPAVQSRPIQSASLLMVIILLFAVIVSSHQLTPFMTILEVSGLVIFRRCRVGILPLLLAVMTATWIVNMALAFLNGNVYWIVQSIGHLDANANSALVNTQTLSPGLQTVILVGRVLTALVYCLAFLGLVRRLRKGFWDLACVILSIAPVPMLAANSYGGEMLFRVYYFSLPFMAFLVAALLYPSPAAGRTWRTMALATALSGGLLFGCLFPYYGKERMNYFSKNEVAAAQYLYSNAPAGSLLLDVDGNYPELFKNYEYFSYESLIYEPDTGAMLQPKQRAALLRTPANYIEHVMEHGNYTAAYLIMTRSQVAMSDEYGYLPIGSLDKIEQALRHSFHFEVSLSNPDATIFTLSERR